MRTASIVLAQVSPSLWQLLPLPVSSPARVAPGRCAFPASLDAHIQALVHELLELVGSVIAPRWSGAADERKKRDHAGFPQHRDARGPDVPGESSAHVDRG